MTTQTTSRKATMTATALATQQAKQAVKPYTCPCCKKTDVNRCKPGVCFWQPRYSEL